MDLPTTAAGASAPPRSPASPSSLAPLSFADYVRLINMNTGKLLAICLVLVFAVYHGLYLASNGVTPCKGLFKHGMVKGDGETWQPWGCMMHTYTKTDCERCFRLNRFYGRPNHILFLGDSRIRQIYHAIRSLNMDGSDPDVYVNSDMVKGIPHLYDSPEQNLKLEYKNATTPEGVKRVIRESPESHMRDSPAPDIVVIGVATHMIKMSNDSAGALAEYKEGMKDLLAEIQWAVKNEGSKVLFMVQPTVDEEKLYEARKMITTEAVERYNRAAVSIMEEADSPAVIWTSVQSLVEEFYDDMPDGLHIPVKALKQAIQMLMNLHCNDKMNFDDGSCCKTADKTTTLQVVTLLFFVTCAALYVIDGTYQKFCLRRQHNHYLPLATNNNNNGGGGGTGHFYQLLTSGGGDCMKNGAAKQEAAATSCSEDVRLFLWSMTKLGVIIAYFYICDRTNFFMKENKYFSHLVFWLPVLYIFIVGLFFSEEAKGTRLLHRDQTDEWKGWMQLMILIYHYTGASKHSIPIYMFIRVLVSCYVFLNGYGNFFYTWLKGDTGIKRFLQVLFRMNFLTIVLCFVMNRPYQDYYFVPLISFWFSMQYLLMAIPPVITAKSTEEKSRHYIYIIFKIVVCVVLISILYMSQVLFERIFLSRPWKALFVSADDSIKEWWFRWWLERYCMIFGVGFALACAVGNRYKLYDDIDRMGCLWPVRFSVVAVVASIAGLGAYAGFVSQCRSKSECNTVHSYAVIVPILAFITLRNISAPIRARFSTFFAWFGRISLELFIAQYHIWLSADTHGVLVLVPNHPMFNLLVTSFIFVCAAHEINTVTGVLVNYFVPPGDSRKMARNLAVFAVIVIVLAVNDGMI